MGREDDPGRTSETLFLANRASRGMRVKSAPFLYWTDASGPRVSRTVGALDADPEGVGRGSRSSHPGLLLEARSPRLDACRCRFGGSQHPVGPTGCGEVLLLGLNEV
jgi:hypothetical protein